MGIWTVFSLLFGRNTVSPLVVVCSILFMIAGGLIQYRCLLRKKAKFLCPIILTAIIALAELGSLLSKNTAQFISLILISVCIFALFGCVVGWCMFSVVQKIKIHHEV